MTGRNIQSILNDVSLKNFISSVIVGGQEDDMKNNQDVWSLFKADIHLV